VRWVQPRVEVSYFYVRWSKTAVRQLEIAAAPAAPDVDIELGDGAVTVHVKANVPDGPCARLRAAMEGEGKAEEERRGRGGKV